MMAASTLLKTFIVEQKAHDQIVAQPLGGPDAKLSAPMRLHPVSDRDNNVQVVVGDIATDLPCTLDLNYPEIPDG